MSHLGFTGRKEGKVFFFEKKKQETFVGAVADQMDKRFLVFFFKKGLLALLLGALMTKPAAAGTDRNALHVAEIFHASCMHFLGKPVDLRNWAADHHLDQTALPPGAQLDVLQPSQVFDASSQDGRLALVSVDDGSCAAIVEHGKLAAVEPAVIAALQKDGFDIERGRSLSRPDGVTVQHLYHAVSGARSSTISFTTRKYADYLTSDPEIIILATLGNE